MRNILTFAALAALACSCATSFQQIATVSDSRGNIPGDGIHRVESGGVEVSFDFWSSFGRADIVIDNKTGEDVAVDLSRTFLVANGLTEDYRAESTSADNLIWVPAGCRRALRGPELMESPYRKCGYARNPSYRKGEDLNFDQKDSPLVFSVRVRLTDGGELARSVQGDFYLSSLFNAPVSLTRESVTVKDPCNRRADPVTVKVGKFAAPYRFYVPYTVSSRYDSDR